MKIKITPKGKIFFEKKRKVIPMEGAEVEDSFYYRRLALDKSISIETIEETKSASKTKSGKGV